MIFPNHTPFLLVFGLLLLPSFLSATHIIGGDITYKCLGNEEYEFTMKIYRDCQNGIPCFDSSTDCASGSTLDGTISIFDGDRVFDGILLKEPKITFIEPNISNPCLRPPSGVCVEEGEYIFKIKLPSGSNDYTISYQRCCRNGTIKNIQDPGMVGATYTTVITSAAQQTCNSSPEFNDFPPIIICNGVDVNFDHSATDIDGDSLVYGLCAPFIGGGTSQDIGGPMGVAPDPETPPPYTIVSYQNGYAFTNPVLAKRPGMVINKRTGLLSGIPTLLGQYVVGICVQAYKDGVLMNEIRRDFQFNVGDCIPIVEAAIKDAEIIQRGDQEIFTLKFCGSDGDLLNESTKRGDIRFQDWLLQIPSGNLSSMDWDFKNITFPSEGIYNGTLILNDGLPCNDTALIEIEVLPDLEANFLYEYDTCMVGPITFADRSVSAIDPSAITSWVWELGNGDSIINQQDFDYQYLQAGAYPVTLTVNDINDCKVQYEETVSYFPVPSIVPLAPITKQGCTPLLANFNNLTDLLTNAYTIEWDFGDGSMGTGLTPNYSYEQPGVYDIFVNITSPIGCQTDTLWTDIMTVLSSPTANFSFTPPIVTNIEGEVQFTDESIGSSFLLWEFDNRATSEESNPSFIFNQPGLHPVLLNITADNGCTDTIMKYVEVLPEIRYTLPNAFTPNQDGKNDLFFGKGNMEDASDFLFSIWNRYGEKIFETNNYQEGWNGRKYNAGKLAPNGVYVAVVTYRNFRGELFTVRGHVSLIR